MSVRGVVVAEGRPWSTCGAVSRTSTRAPWVKDTVVNTYSLTKTMTTLRCCCCWSIVGNSIGRARRPLLAEFAANGKGAVLVRHVLGHTSGVSGWQQPVSLADICDAVRAEDLLAEQAPWWEPGTASGYHATNFGHLVVEWSAVSPGRSGRVLRDGGRGGLRRRLSDRCSCRGRSEDRAADRATALRIRLCGTAARRCSSRHGEPGDPGAGDVEQVVAAPRSVARTVTETRGRSHWSNRSFRTEAGRCRGAAAASRDDRQDLRHPVRRLRPGARRALRFGLGYALPAPAIHPSIPDGRVCCGPGTAVRSSSTTWTAG